MLNPRLATLIGKVERLEQIDFEREAMLQALDMVAVGDKFAEEMIAQMQSQDEDHRYSRVKSVEYNAVGGIAKVEFHEPRNGVV